MTRNNDENSPFDEMLSEFEEYKGKSTENQVSFKLPDVEPIEHESDEEEIDLTQEETEVNSDELESEKETDGESIDERDEEGDSLDDEENAEDASIETVESIDEYVNEEDEDAPTDEEDAQDDEQYEGGFGGGLLAGMDYDSESYEGEREDEEEKEDEVPKPKNENNKQNKDADELAKEFFVNLIAKAKGVFGGKGKDKKAEMGDKSANKEKRKLKISKPDFKLNKKAKIILFATLILAAVLITSLILWNNSYKIMENIESTVKFQDEVQDEEIPLTINKLQAKDKVVKMDIKNDGDISANLSIFIEFKEKSLNPFSSSKIECESDIVSLTTGDKIEESVTCNKKINKKSKYKIKVNLDSF